ncbi:MAG: hypothetical protein WBC33_01430 [Conexibacter sp.]
MNIAIWANFGMLNAQHRALHPGAALGRRGHRVAMFETPELERRRSLGEFDVVLLHQNLTEQTAPLLRRFREAGAGVVWDNDDDIVNPPPRVRGQKARRDLWTQKSASLMRAAIGLADIVTTPSEILADIYRSAGAERVQVVENFVPDDFSHTRSRGHEGTVIGWVAAAEHAIDLQELELRDLLQRVLDAHEQAHVVSIGIDAGLRSERYRHLRRVEYDELPAHIADFDIAIAPMTDVPFNRARSNGKLKEYAALGVAWLASPVGPYVGLGERQGGRLVRDGDWFEELSRLVVKERARRKLAKRGQRWARSQTIGKHAAEWEAVLGEAVERARERR